MIEAPRILVTANLRAHEEPESDVDVWRYVVALREAGAEPIVVRKGHETSNALRRPGIRGVLFSGGGDIDARHYGGSSDRCSRVDVERDAGEMELFQQAYFNNVPILAICRGMQLANVALGGSLFEDIPNHHSGKNGPERFEMFHEVQIRPSSRLAAIVRTPGERLRVNSVHHQAIDRLAMQLVGCAHSDDGILEAVEAEEAHPGFFLGVQWHPEALRDRASAAILQVFVEGCQARSSEAATSER